MAHCPLKSLDSWKDLVKAQGESVAYFLWDKYKGDVPAVFYKPLVSKADKSSIESIKKGVPELFESNPELANAVYEAAGFITPKKTGFTEDEAKTIVNKWKSNAVNLRGQKPSGKELNDLDNAANALFKKLLSLKGEKISKAPTKATLITDLFDRTKDKQVDLLEDSPASNLLNIAIRFFNGGLYDNDIIPQQKQQAQQKFQEYIDVTGRQDIEGFKEFVSSNNETLYQNNTNQSNEEYIASEKTIRDLAARMADRIGLNVRYESDRTKNYKGKLKGNTAVINLAYATLDTPIHEILGHPIIRAIKNKHHEAFNKINFIDWVQKNKEEYLPDVDFMKGVMAENEYDEAFNKYGKEWEKINNDYLKNFNSLYQNLLKELEYGKGKEVLDRIKKDYELKLKPEIIELESIVSGQSTYEVSGKEFNNKEDAIKYQQEQTKYYTLEEQQEEAIVELLGLYTADRLDKVKDGKLISLLKRLLKEMKAFMRSLIGQKEVEIDKLPDNMTLGDLADLLAYSNSKLILPGNEVIYTTPDNQTFKTYQEASNHISELAESVKNVDLNSIKFDNFQGLIGQKDKTNNKIVKSFVKNEADYEEGIPEYYDITYEDNTEQSIGVYELGQHFNSQNLINYIKQFIEKNKEYEQSKEIIEEWKKVNGIKYDPEEVYSRGQGFYSVVGAYSDFDVELMFQNLLAHIEDNKKAGGEFTISAFTKPVDKKIGHLEGGGGKIKFKIFPKSEDIKWAANTDVYSGSVWDASEKVSKDKKSELIGVSYTKSPSLQNINSVQPNLASIIDNLAHHHNELGIALTGNNFRLEYDDNVSYSTKKLINNINSILDQKFGKLTEPKISKTYKDTNKYAVEYYETGIRLGLFNTREEAQAFIDSGEYEDIDSVIISTISDKKNIVLSEDIFRTKNRLINENYELDLKRYKEASSGKIPEHYDNYTDLDGKLSEKITVFALNVGNTSNEVGMWQSEEYYDTVKDYIKGEEQNKHGVKFWILSDEFKKEALASYKKPTKQKEYTSQALINTKIAALKKANKKYPRSLIRSEVKPIDNRTQNYGFEENELPFQKIKQNKKVDSFRNIEYVDNVLRDIEVKLGFRKSDGKQNTFERKEQASTYSRKQRSQLSEYDANMFKSTIEKTMGRDKYGKLKEVYFVKLHRAGFNTILDEIHGEFNKSEANVIKKDLLNNYENTTSKSVIDKLLESDLLTSEIKEVLQKLSDIDVPVVFVSNESNSLMSTNGVEVAINLNNLYKAHPKLVAEGIVHELVHIKTVNALENPITEADAKLQQRVSYLFNKFKRLDTQNRYGGTNEIEFVAELMAKKEFREYVKGLEDKSIWSRIVRFIAEFLGIKVGSEKLIQSLEEVISKSIKVQKFEDRSMEVDSVTRKQLAKIIKSVGTRMKTLEYRKKEKTEAKYKIILTDLQNSYKDHKDLEGITLYLDKLNEFTNSFDSVVNDIWALINAGDLDSVIQKGGTVHGLGTFATSNLHIIDELISNLKIIARENPDSEDIIKNIEEKLSTANIKIKQLKQSYSDISKVLMAKFLVPFGLGRSLNHIQSILSKPVRDISGFTLWARTLQDSGDEFLGMVDVAIKNEITKANHENIEYQRNILELKKKLENAGIKDTKFMIKKDSKGENTHYFLTERDIVAYREARDKFSKTLIDIDKASDPKRAELENKGKWAEFFKSHGINSNYNEDAYNTLITKKKQELGANFPTWLALNGIINPSDNSITIPYAEDKEYTKLHANRLKSEYYWEILNSKYKFEKHLPASKRHLRRIPQIRKDFIERVKGGDWSRMFEVVKEGFQIKEDEIEYGTDFGLTDEANNVISFLPIYFTGKLENPKDLSEDITSSMIAYGFYNTKREKLQKIKDVMEIGKDILKERGVLQVSGKGKIVTSARNFLGTNEVEEIKQAGAGNIYKRYEEYLNMFLYGKEKVEGGEVLGINTEKAMDRLAQYTGMKMLAVNFFAGVANANIGNVTTFMEALEGKYFKLKNTRYADKVYWSNVPGTLSDIGNRQVSSKMALWAETMDSMNNIEERVFGVDSERKTKVGQLLNTNSLFFISNIVEHYLHNKVSLAVADTYRFDKKKNRFVFENEFYKELRDIEAQKIKEIKELSGKDVKSKVQAIKNMYDKQSKLVKDKLDSEWDSMTNFWEAHETKKNRLEIKSEFKNADYIEDKLRFINKQHGINKTLQGAYAKLDKTSAQKYALGRLGFMFRKYLIPALDRRFIKRHTDFEKGIEEEGYYRIFGKFMKEVFTDLKSGTFSLYKTWNTLTSEEKAANLRIIKDTVFLITAYAVGVMLSNLAADDDDNWWLNSAAYLSNRLFTEYGALYPLAMPTELAKILNSPLAATNAIQSFSYLFSSFNWFDEIEQGKYKGLYVIQRNLIRTVPMASTIYNLQYPEEYLKYFNNKAY